jgi:predicted NAD/FAD-binding protein
MTKTGSTAPRVAVVGSGITGLAAASYLWAHSDEGRMLDLTVLEKDEHIGGHAWTQLVGDIPVDIGFMVCNQGTYHHRHTRSATAVHSPAPRPHLLSPVCAVCSDVPQHAGVV